MVGDVKRVHLSFPFSRANAILGKYLTFDDEPIRCRRENRFKCKLPEKPKRSANATNLYFPANHG